MPETTVLIDLNTRLQRSSEILFSEIDQDKVMIDIQRGAYFGLNPVAGEIWEMLETQRTPTEIIQTLLQDYDIDEATCQAETLAVLQRMVRLNLVHVAG